MGWIETDITYRKMNGDVDRKQECDHLLNYISHDKEGNETQRCRVVKSSMVGSTYYAAVELTNAGKAPFIYGVVIRTSTREDIWFGYKIMGEECGPCYYDCPMSILELLSPTEEEWALEWREKCKQKTKEKAKKKKLTSELSALPVGTVIEFVAHANLKCHQKGDTIQVRKQRFYGRKRPLWVNGNYYYTADVIGPDYKVVEGV